jgi:anthranilate synthase component 1
VIVDHQQQQTFMMAEPGHESLLSRIADDLEQAGNVVAASTGTVNIKLSEENPWRYLQGVERIKNYIVEGDVFQVNLSRVWQGRSDAALQPADIYQRLCENNPAPFAGLALIDDAAVISSSPERLVKVNKGRVETRPIAGTRPRSTQAAGDHAVKEELLAHPKERAEHIMLIDLERNDLGRVCVPGSVKVDELMVLESYAHVHHIVSNVSGELRDGVTPGEVIRAVFPGGTITGCPKVRCMEIIAELEGEGRGAYTGAMGYLNHNGDMDLNILIRTITQNGQQIQLRAGAGIVADSVPEKELDETRAKARGLLLALTNH